MQNTSPTLQRTNPGKKSSKSNNWHNWVYFGTRWLVLIVVPIAIMLVQKRTFESFDALSDLALAIGIGVATNLALGLFLLVEDFREYVMFVAVPTDWLIAGLFARISLEKALETGAAPAVANSHHFLLLGIAGMTVVMGLLRFGSSLGTLHAAGTLIACGIALVFTVGIETITADPMFFVVNYAPVVIFVVALATMPGVWVERLYSQERNQRKQLREAFQHQRTQLSDLRARTKLISQMAASLNATLRYDKILDAALDVGRMSLRKNAKQRVISIVMLFTPDDRLEIATSRGLPYLDENKSLYGQRGVIAEALDEGVPVTTDNVEGDPELSEFIAFRNIKSVLCIPLRAGFDNFGILLYGTEQANAFDTDHTDTLTAIGTQATVALQNAILYENLLEEKERLIEMEEQARKELVRDLHDVPTQTISAVTMRLGIVPRLIERNMIEQAVTEVKELEDLARRATEEIRHVLFTLRPLSLESSGLSTALKQLAERMESTHHQKMRVSVDPQAEKLLDSNQQGTLFYLIEEAANNARKHAKAELITASVEQQGNYIVVRIVDNGVGFDMGKVNSNYSERGSFGMVNMKERAELVDGALDMKSAPGRGTQITVTVPLDPQTVAAGTAPEPEPATRLEAAARIRR